MPSKTPLCLLMALGAANASRPLESGSARGALAADTAALAEQWDSFKSAHRPDGYASFEEEQFRLEIFRKKMSDVAKWNAELIADGHEAVFGVTKFSDYTDEETDALKGLNLDAKEEASAEPAPVWTRPEDDASTPFVGTGAKNWCDNGACSKIKNQEQCGSCWAFAATEQIESDVFLATGTMYDLAPQQIVDCATADQPQVQGCNGGFSNLAVQYVIDVGGMEAEKDYPYQGVDGTCKFDKSKVQTTVKKYTEVTGETDMEAYVLAHGPLQINVDARKWSAYTGGILSARSCCGLLGLCEIDHAVQMIGIDQNEGSWTVRNSWGTDWGENGFIRIELGKDACGITKTSPFYTNV